jgi:hypothetical protein
MDTADGAPKARDGAEIPWGEGHSSTGQRTTYHVRVGSVYLG